jgi:cell division protein FtsL
VVITALIVGVVSLSALLVQASFREQDLRVELSALAEEHDRLALEAVALSSPGRVASWARGEGMVVAEQVEILRVRAVSR